MRRVIEGAPLPEVDGDSAPFWEGAAAGELRMQACDGCGRGRFPPRPMCPWCRSLDASWSPMSGRGTVWSFAVPHPPLLPAFADLAPYVVVVVALDDDPTLRMVGNLVATPDGAINEVDPATVRIGEPVQVVFQHAGEDVFLPRWMRCS
ncbi:MAG: Zn-ribbon domain-containing OB-fold protein [Acidimicrobiales bacterium]